MRSRNQPPSNNDIEGPKNVTPYTWRQTRHLRTINAAVRKRAGIITESKKAAGDRITLSEETITDLHLLSAYKAFMSSPPVRQVELQRAEKLKKVVSYGAVGAAVLGIILLEGGSLSSIGNDRPEIPTSSVDSDRRALLDNSAQAASAMRTLGICASELSAQSKLDDWGAAHTSQRTELAERAEQERQTVERLEAQAVACTPVGNAYEAHSFTVQTSLGVRSVSLSRSDITLYSAADWCDTREAWKELYANQQSQQQTNALDSFIAIGDQTFGSKTCT